MKKIKVSLVIPTFNNSSTIKFAVESILSQNAEDWEIIVIDDGSTDNTSFILSNFIKEKKVIYKYQENKGVSAARNLGALLSKGQFIIFLDSDDFLLPGLKDELELANFEDFDLIFWQVIKKINGEISLWKPVKLGKVYNNITGTFLAGSVCYRKELFFKVEGYDSKISFGENYELGIRLSHCHNLKIKYINQAFLLYAIDTHNRINNQVKKRLTSAIYQYKKHKNVFSKDVRSHSKIIYSISFYLEKSNKNSSALRMYKKSWLINPFNLKAILKITYLTLNP